jgi:hypothetical protein
MTLNYIAENTKSRARLVKLAKFLTEKEFHYVIYKEGWTIAVALAHLAFWDERRRLQFKIWREKGVSPTPAIDDIVNDVLIPILLTIPPKKAAALAVKAAEELDKEIEEMPDKMRKEVEALNEPKALDRASHRNQHLDEIDEFLKAKKLK